MSSRLCATETKLRRAQRAVITRGVSRLKRRGWKTIDRDPLRNVDQADTIVLLRTPRCCQGASAQMCAQRTFAAVSCQLSAVSARARKSESEKEREKNQSFSFSFSFRLIADQLSAVSARARKSRENPS